MNWKNPETEKPNDGDYILIREYYKSPKYGQFRINYRVMMYFDKYGFELEYASHRNIYKYKITHWMKIEEPE